MKSHVVVAISEEGDASVFGPYKRKKAERVACDVMDDDSGQKTRAEVIKLEKYESPDNEEEDDE